MNRRRFRFLLVSCLAAVWQTGCNKQEQITRYTVPKPHVLLASNHVDRPHKAMSSARSQDRLIGAIVPRREKTWFFKLMGPDEAVQERMTEFLTFIQSIRFPDGRDQPPSWTLPAGWRRRPGSGMRYATFALGSEGDPLELTVIPLPSAGENLANTVLNNVNRWRGQLGLPPVGGDRLFAKGNRFEETRQIEVDGVTVTLVNLAGPDAPSRTGAASSGSNSKGTPSASAAQPALTYTTPEEWQPLKAGGLRKAAFRVERDGREVEITVIDLASAAGELLPNVNRWRGQIGLGPITRRQLDREIQQINIGDSVGHFVELLGPRRTAGRREAILAVILNDAGRAWFFKLRGDADLARAEKKRFEAFVQSVRFASAEGAEHGQ